MKINQIIRQRRKEVSLTQAQVADYLGVLSTPAVNKREQELSVPDTDLLITLSEALETPVSALLGETVPAPKTDGLEALAYFAVLDGSYPGWNLNDPETAVVATSLHAFEWVLVRAAPFVLTGTAIGLLLSKKSNRDN